MKNQYESPILANTSSGANAYDEARKEEEHESNRHRAPGGRSGPDRDPKGDPAHFEDPGG